MSLTAFGSQRVFIANGEQKHRQTIRGRQAASTVFEGLSIPTIGKANPRRSSPDPLDANDTDQLEFSQRPRLHILAHAELLQQGPRQRRGRLLGQGDAMVNCQVHGEALAA